MRQAHWELKLAVIIKCTENQQRNGDIYVHTYITYIFLLQLLVSVQAHSRCSKNTCWINEKLGQT